MSQTPLQALLDRDRAADRGARDALILSLVPLVGTIVDHAAQVDPSLVGEHREDLLAVGLRATIAAVDRYDGADASTVIREAWSAARSAVVHTLRDLSQEALRPLAAA